MSERLKTLQHEYKRIIWEAESLKPENPLDPWAEGAEARYDSLYERADALEAQIAREQKAEHHKEWGGTATATHEPGNGEEHEERIGQQQGASQRAAFRAYLRGGQEATKDSTIEGMTEWLAYQKRHVEYQRALGIEQDVQGGFFVPPDEVVGEIIKAVNDVTPIRGLANVRPPLLPGQSLGAIVQLRRPERPRFRSQIDVNNQLTPQSDDDPTFGRKRLTPQRQADAVTLPVELVEVDSRVEDTWLEELATVFGEAQEVAFLTGTGTGEPLGMLTPMSADLGGISTARDVATDNTAAGLTALGLVNAQTHLKAAYSNRATWMFHRTIIGEIRKLTLGNARWIWETDFTRANPNILLGRPVVASEWMPNTIAADQYVGLYADFSNYWIVDGSRPRVQRLVELYAARDAIGYHVYMYVDGAPRHEEAFVRIQLGN